MPKNVQLKIVQNLNQSTPPFGLQTLLFIYFVILLLGVTASESTAHDSGLRTSGVLVVQPSRVRYTMDLWMDCWEPNEPIRTHGPNPESKVAEIDAATATKLLDTSIVSSVCSESRNAPSPESIQGSAVSPFAHFPSPRFHPVSPTAFSASTCFVSG